MGSFAKSDQDSDVSKVVAIRESWIAAVKCGDIEGLVSLASDDIVVVHGNGKCVCGKDELRKNLAHYLELFDIEQRDSSGEITVHDKWALLFSEVRRTLTTVRAGAQVLTHSRIVAVFTRQSDGAWRVCRVLVLAD
jgi:ketosteroid isomerase-like protein